MANQESPIIRLINRDGDPVDAYTLPPQGPADPVNALPVVLALGVDLVRTYKAIPAMNKTNASLFDQSIVQLLPENPNRRYLKIINNGTSRVELWIKKPTIDQAARTDDVLQGEVLLPNYYGIVEADTCRKNAIFATSVDGASGLMILEG